MVSWVDVTENRHVGRRSHLRPKDTLAEVTFPPHNAAEYKEHAQLLTMDYSNMLTAVAVRKYLLVMMILHCVLDHFILLLCILNQELIGIINIKAVGLNSICRNFLVPEM